MPYINRAMTDGGGGSKTTFNYSAPKTITKPKIAVPAPKANTDTQTRYEQQQLAAQTAANAAAKARADATFAAINAQKIETARLAQEAYARAQAAAEAARLAEIKRQKIERDNWENWQANDTVQSKPKVLASAVPSKQSFWNQLGSSFDKGTQTYLGTQDQQPTSPKYWAGEANPITVWEQMMSKKEPIPDNWQVPGTVKSGAAKGFWNELKDSWKEMEQTTPNQFLSKKPNPKYVGDREENYNPYAEGGLNATDPWDVKPKQNLGKWFNQTMEGAENKVDEWWYNQPKVVGIKNEYYHDPRLVAGNPNYDQYTREENYNPYLPMPKNPYKYWSEAKGDQLDFSRYADPGAAAAQADEYYQMFNQNFKTDQTAAQKDIDLLQSVNNPSMTGGSMIPGLEKLQNPGSVQYKAVNGPTFDPATGTGQRMMLEQLGKAVPSYHQTWLDMQADIDAGNVARGKISDQEQLLENLRNSAPNGYPAKKKKPGDLFSTFVLNGRRYTVPNEMLSFASDYPWQTSITNYAPPKRWVDAGHQWNEAYDNGWQPEVGPGEAAVPVADPEAGGSGYGDGGYGNSGYGSGGSYWSPSGYYDNQFTKDRYGSFQNLAKWVI